MTSVITYTESEHMALMGGREIVVRNLVPKMSDEKRREAKEKIQGELYNVFCKYMT